MGTNTFAYSSDTREDAIFETAYDNFVFTKSASSNDGSLIQDVPMYQTLNTDVWDDDGLTTDDWRGIVSINTAAYYNKDNTTHVYKTHTSGEITIKLRAVGFIKK